MANIDFEYKTINDPVHGSIKVSETELAVINTPSFQRLRGLKQLGLAEYVFPGATHTRFAHSLGVLHIASQMLIAIEKNHKRKYGRKGLPFTQDEKQKIRLAALLHDVGHLPLSHAMEQPIQRKLGEEPPPSLQEKPQHTEHQTRVFGDLDSTANAELDDTFSHETYGMELLVCRGGLTEALGRFNEGNEIGKIFAKKHVDYYKYSQFITGTIDADRIDF
ncbi:HD domain-containing protein, partial [bacterium]|nr:HD domain-containing protein [bacterium]